MNIIQTNGILISQDYIQLIEDNNVNLGISIDGPTYEDNRYRFKNEKEFILLLSKLKMLTENNVEYAIFCTITLNNIGHIKEILAFIEVCKPYAYTLIPVISDQYCIEKDTWLHILKMTREFYYRTGIKHSYVENMINGKPQMCMLNGNCQSFITLDSDGFINQTCQVNKELIIGNIYDADILDKIMQYTHKPRIINRNSIYSYLNDRKYIYFQGDGCYYRKEANSNNDFILGIVDFLREES